MATYTVCNGSDEQLVDINAGGVDVDAMSFKDGITLTSGELVILLNGSSFGKKNVAVFADQTSDTAKDQKKRSAAIAGLYTST